MKAELIRTYGGPEVLKLEEVARPEPADDEVIIRVRAAGVNPLDWKVREGAFQEAGLHHLPLIPGWDVAGEIDQIGRGTQRFQVGDPVFALLDMTKNGGYAEFVRAPESAVAHKPETLDYISAASVPMASLTAYQALDKMQIKRGDRILIHGAAGSVGSFAVQFAALRGAYVIGIASSGDAAYLTSLRADEALSYEPESFEQHIEPVDAILDVIGGNIVKRSWQLLKSGGTIISTVEPPSELEAKRHGVRAEMMQVHPDANLLTEIGRLIDQGEIKVRISTVLPLNEAAKAQEIARTTHHRGKVVLQVA